MTIGYISLGIVAFRLAVKYFAILPGAIKDWNEMFTIERSRMASASAQASGEKLCQTE
jgi:hypothetical protein